MTYEELEKVLMSHFNIKDVHKSSCGDKSFKRNFHFTIFGKQYKITWYHDFSTLYIGEIIWHHNFLTLYIGDIVVFFNKVFISRVWPNNAKFNLQFDSNEETVAILPIEYYANR